MNDGVGVIAKIESIKALSDALWHKGIVHCSHGAGSRTVWVGRKSMFLSSS